MFNLTRFLKSVPPMICLLFITALFGGCGRKDCKTFLPHYALALNETSHRASQVVGFKPGQRLVIADLQGPGVIRHIWLTTQAQDSQIYGKIVLRAFWDGEPHPSIEAPLGDFFGTGFGEERTVHSAAVEMIPSGPPGRAALTCWLPMPFEQARLELENQSDEEVPMFSIVNWSAFPRLPQGAGRLHAQWRRSGPVNRGQGHIALQAKGEGAYIGMVFSIQRLGEGAWVEGGDDVYINLDESEWKAIETWDAAHLSADRRIPAGEKSVANQPMGPVRPTLAGVGCEDYFGMSWGFRELDRGAFHGISLGPEDKNRLTAYRFHLNDPIRFQKNIIVHMRNHGWDVQARADDIATVAFWYQNEPHLTFPELPAADARLRPLE